MAGYGEKEHAKQVANALDKHLRSTLGLPNATVVHNVKLTSMVGKAGKDNISLPIDFREAGEALGKLAADKQGFSSTLDRLRQRPASIKEAVVALSTIAMDPDLKPLRKLGAMQPASQHAPTAAAPSAQPAPKASAPPPAASGIGKAPALQSQLGNITNTAAAPPPVAAPAPVAPAAASAAPAVHASLAAALPPTRLAAPQEQQQQAPPKGGPFFSSNPMFGQEAAMSPAVRAKDYTPLLAHDLTAAARRRAQEARPAVPSAASLFQPGAGLQQQQRPLHQLQLGSPFRLPGSPDHPPQQEQQQRLLGRLPQWSHAREHLTGLDLVAAAASHTAAAPDQPLTLSLLPPSVQETAVINDLLYAFMGLDGRYVRARMAPAAAPGAAPASPPQRTVTFCVEEGLEPCLMEMVEKVLPICEYVAVLQRFVETRSAFSNGLVAHALAASLRALLQDWMLMVTQLEHQLHLGRLSMQGLIFYCQAPLGSLRLLATLAADAASRELSSAGLLNLLHAQLQALAGDPQGRALVGRLLAAAAEPYFRLLGRWLCEGVLDDPYGEFMVREDLSVMRDPVAASSGAGLPAGATPARMRGAGSAGSGPHSPLPRSPSPLGGREQDEAELRAYWQHRYTLRRAAGGVGSSGGAGAEGAEGELDVPVFLRAHAEMILTTGKYLNAIRECGRAVERPLPQGEALTFDLAGTYGNQIQTAHEAASSALLRVLVRECDLLAWLRSIKHYFLLDQGDVAVHMAETGREELDKPGSGVSRTRLASLLELAVRTSSVAAMDALSDNLTFGLDPRSLPELLQAALAPTAAAAGPGSGSGSPHVSSGTVVAGGGAGTSRLGPGGGAGAGGPQVTGWDLLLLGYKVAWPISLVVSPRQLRQYQVVFKHLWVLKRCERELSAAWARMQHGSRRSAWQLREELKAAYGLCQRQMFLVQELLRYAQFDVLEPLWQAMEAGIRKATNVDEVILCHETFLARALDGLLLSRPRLVKALVALEASVRHFCAHVNATWDTAERAAQAEAAARPAAPARNRSMGGRGPQPSAGGAAPRDAAGPVIGRVGDAAVARFAELQQQFGEHMGALERGLKDLYDGLMRRSAYAPTQPASAALQPQRSVGGAQLPQALPAPAQQGQRRCRATSWRACRASWTALA